MFDSLTAVLDFWFLKLTLMFAIRLFASFRNIVFPVVRSKGLKPQISQFLERGFSNINERKNNVEKIDNEHLDPMNQEYKRIRFSTPENDEQRRYQDAILKARTHIPLFHQYADHDEVASTIGRMDKIELKNIADLMRLVYMQY